MDQRLGQMKWQNSRNIDGMIRTNKEVWENRECICKPDVEVHLPEEVAGGIKIDSVHWSARSSSGVELGMTTVCIKILRESSTPWKPKCNMLKRLGQCKPRTRFCPLFFSVCIYIILSFLSADNILRTLRVTLPRLITLAAPAGVAID